MTANTWMAEGAESKRDFPDWVKPSFYGSASLKAVVPGGIMLERTYDFWPTYLHGAKFALSGLAGAFCATGD